MRDRSCTLRRPIHHALPLLVLLLLPADSAWALTNAEPDDDPDRWFVGRVALLETGVTRGTGVIDSVVDHDGTVFARVLTTSHAFEIRIPNEGEYWDEDPRDFFFEDGRGDRWEVVNGYLHPDYQSSTIHDVAVLFVLALDGQCRPVSSCPVPLIEEVEPNPEEFDGWLTGEGGVGCTLGCNDPACDVPCSGGCCPGTPALYGRRGVAISLVGDDYYHSPQYATWFDGEMLVARVGSPGMWSAVCGGDSGSPLLFPTPDRGYRLPAILVSAWDACRPPERYPDVGQTCHSDHQCRYSNRCEQGVCVPNGQAVGGYRLTAPHIAEWLVTLELPAENSAPCLAGPESVATPSRVVFDVIDAEGNGPYRLSVQWQDDDGVWIEGFPPELDRGVIEELGDGSRFAVRLGQDHGDLEYSLRVRAEDNLGLAGDWLNVSTY